MLSLKMVVMAPTGTCNLDKKKVLPCSEAARKLAANAQKFWEDWLHDPISNLFSIPTQIWRCLLNDKPDLHQSNSTFPRMATSSHTLRVEGKIMKILLSCLKKKNYIRGGASHWEFYDKQNNS